MTHNERVLELLNDRAWHSHHELYALHVIAHSRIAELRRRGYGIEHKRDGQLYLYRLVSLPEGEPQPASATPTCSGQLAGSACTGPSPSESETQLAFEVAA